MTNPEHPGDNYDRIARWYEVDMGQSMPFDDRGFYRAIGERAGGPVLELGCGSGRILLELAAAGLDVTGVDRSAAMLASAASTARQASIEARICRMDVRALAFSPAFATVLCPYSLITYMAQPGEAQHLLEEAASVMLEDGTLVIDAFIPRGNIEGQGWRVDYRRRFGNDWLERSKRIDSVGDGVNRIERHYRLLASDGGVREEVFTTEVIRPLAPGDLLALVSAAGLAVGDTWWDYGATNDAGAARFFTVAARRRAQSRTQHRR
jgi:SAM-dependent methyltransferase